MTRLKDLTPEQRGSLVYHHIDPGFINRRKCFVVGGRPLVETFTKYSKGDGWPEKVHDDHLLVDLMLHVCRVMKAPTLSAALQDPTVGTVFTSTQRLAGAGDAAYEQGRVENVVLLGFDYDRRVVVSFDTRHICCDTGYLEQAKPHTISIVGQIREVTADTVLIHPIIMGAPTFMHLQNEGFRFDRSWLGWEFYEVFPTDIDQFERARAAPVPDAAEWTDYMRKTTEAAIKERLCGLLGDVPRKDWGGSRPITSRPASP